ncbi:MAG: DegT/DnrJ/EryC1/StrS family aminotransferase [Planctomycetia bacterium]|nr:DegT/DnrJ/EryC1/StrS family aminotransferase [Planctomycetia bacterium]
MTSPAVVPFLDLTREGNPLQEEISTALRDVVLSGQFVLGPQVEQFEKTLAAYAGATEAVACSSGSEALLMALMALEIGPGDEVIVPSFTFFATASCVSRLGATPIFADMVPGTFNIHPESVAAKMTDRTRAIIAVHLFGQSADMTALAQLAEKRGIVLIEDAAQAIGSECVFRGETRRVGSMGRMACFSFYPTKNLGAMGDGGAITTCDASLAERLRLLRGHGMKPRYFHQIIGINGRLDAFQGAVLNIKFRHLDRWTKARCTLAAQYRELFAQTGLDDDLITLPLVPDTGRHVWNQFSVRIHQGRRDALRKYLLAQGVQTEIYYPLGLHEQECFRSLGGRLGDLPVTEHISREILALPIFPGLKPEEQETVVRHITQFLRNI